MGEKTKGKKLSKSSKPNYSQIELRQRFKFKNRRYRASITIGGDLGSEGTILARGCGKSLKASSEIDLASPGDIWEEKGPRRDTTNAKPSSDEPWLCSRIDLCFLFYF